MGSAPSLISVTDFKRLIRKLKEDRPDICIRYRLLGEMWATNFMSIFYVAGKGVLLNDENRRIIITINDVSNIMQFEIDKPFDGYQPYFHYEIQPLLDATLQARF